MLRIAALPLGRVRGTRVLLDPVVPLALLYLAWSLLDRYTALERLSATLPFDMRFGPASWAAILALGMLGGLVVHHATRVAVAVLAGARVRSVTLTVLGSRDELWAPGRTAQVELRAALGAPLSSVALGLLLLALAQTVGPRRADVHLAIWDLSRFQLGLGLVNLLPAFPLDGGRVLRAACARRLGLVGATRLASSIGKGLAGACVAVAIAEGAIPLLFLAVYLYGGAISEERNETLCAALGPERVADAMLPALEPLAAHERVGEAVLALLRSGAPALPVVAHDGAPLAALAIADVRRVPASARWTTAVADLLPSLGGVVPASANLADVRREMARRNAAAVAVVDPTGTLVGVLPLEAIERRIELADLVAAERSLWRLEPASDAAARHDA